MGICIYIWYQCMRIGNTFNIKYDNDDSDSDSIDENIFHLSLIEGRQHLNGTWFHFVIRMQQEINDIFKLENMEQAVILLVFDYGNKLSLNELDTFCQSILNQQQTLKNCILIGWNKVNYTDKVVENDEVKEFVINGK